MTFTRLSGAKSLRDPLVSQLLGEWVASSPLAKARWYEATEVAQLPLIRNKQIEAMKQYASVLFPAPELIGLLMGLNVPKSGFRHVSEFMTRRGSAYTAATGLPFPRPILSRDLFTDTWKELVKPVALDPPVSVPEPPTSAALGRCNPGPATSNHAHPLRTPSIRRGRSFSSSGGDAYPCAGGSWTQLFIGLLNHSARAHAPAYLWVIGMAVCGDKDMAALGTIWSKTLRVYGRFVSVSFLC